MSYEVVLVDDAADVRAVVHRQLRLSGRFIVVGEGGSGADAIRLVKQHRPALMVLDASMPDMDGLEALPVVLQSSPETKVVMLSGFAGKPLEVAAKALGAADVVSKADPIRDLPARLLLAVGDSADEDADGDDIARPAPTAAEELVAAGDEAVMAEHLERFRAFFDAAAIGMATMSLSGTVVRANGALLRLADSTEAGLVGRRYAGLAADTSDSLVQVITAVARGDHDVATCEHRFGRDGSRWVRTTVTVIRDTGGRPLYLFLQAEDVTTQRAALNELRRSEQRFRLLVDAVTDYAIFMLDPEGHVSTWNAGAERMNGYTADEIVGRHIRTFYPPDARRRRHPERELEIAARDGRYEEEGFRVRKDGSRFWANVIISAIYDDAGAVVGFGKVTRDITSRRHADEQLRVSEERFRLMVETVAEYAIFMLDPAGRVSTWNTGAQRLKGYTAEEIVGQHFRVFYPPDVQQRRHPEHELDVAVKEGRYEEEGWRIRKDGSRFWANVVITALLDDDGHLVGFGKVTRDMTERRAAAEATERAAMELAEANARLLEANEQTAAFLAVTAHELHGPIATMTGAVDILAEHWDALDEDDRAESFRNMRSAAKRTRRLLDDLLTASRLDAGMLDVEAEPFRPAAAVQEAVSGLVGVNLDVEVNVADELVALGDQSRTVQVLANLLANAAKYGRPPIVVEAGRVGESIELRVSDGGLGVTEELRPLLFEKFTRGRRHGQRGTGLGLYIVRSLTRAQGGDVRYEERDGRPTFVVTLLAAAPAGDAPSR